MSFVPPPQKATAAPSTNGVVSNNTADAVAEVTAGVEDAFITSRTFDLYWVDKSALMYKDGIVKVRFCDLMWLDLLVCARGRSSSGFFSGVTRLLVFRFKLCCCSPAVAKQLPRQA